MSKLVLNSVYEKIIEDLFVQQYSVVESFFTVEEVTELRSNLLMKYEEDLFKKSGIGNKVNKLIVDSIRGDFILWLNEQEQEKSESNFFKKVNDLSSYLNSTCYMGITESEFHYALYPVNTFYKRHLDTFQNDSRRKLSLVCYLNDENWKPEYGGELVIYKNNSGKEVPRVIYPLMGKMVIFESQILEHEVKPVKKERLSITGWFKTF